MTRALTLLAILGWLAPACQTEEPPQPSVYATLTRSCAPFDGPAVTLYLSEHPIEGAVPAPPYDMISVYRGLGEVLGQSILVESTQVGSAVKCLSASDCRPYSGAVIKFGAPLRQYDQRELPHLPVRRERALRLDVSQARAGARSLRIVPMLT